MSKVLVSLWINGETHELAAEPHRSLLSVLRDDLGLTGTKQNCLEGECGVCSVLLDGKVVNACLLLAVQCEGSRIVTIEGLEDADGGLHPLQTAFMQHGAVQCGYCIPGMIIAAKGLLDSDPRPTDAAIREAIAGVLCRCTGYQKIVAAVAAAADQMSQKRDAR